MSDQVGNPEDWFSHDEAHMACYQEAILTFRCFGQQLDGVYPEITDLEVSRLYVIPSTSFLMHHSVAMLLSRDCMVMPFSSFTL